METLNDKFCKVTGLTWDLNQYIASLKGKGMTDEQISEKILWLVPDGAMLDDPEYRKSLFTKELLSDETLAELGIDENAKFSPDEESEEDEHDYVDLGLPSGLLWAANNIQDKDGNELYFAWGETSGYTAEQVGADKYFIWDDYTDESGVTHHNDYKFGPYNGEDATNYGMTKYNSEGPTELESEDDAASQIWKNGWRMPTKEEFEELTANTEYEWTTFNGVQGAKFTSTVSGYTDKFLFFPAVGGAEDGGVSGVGGYGFCWSVSLDDESVSGAWELNFGDGYCGVGSNIRCCGCSVRPVRAK